MPANFMPTGEEFLRVAPETVLIVAGTLLMVFDAVTSQARKRWLTLFAFIALLGALVAAAAAGGSPGTAFSAMLAVDGFATFFRILFIAIGLLTVLASTDYLQREGAETGEYYALLLFSISGQCLMATAQELVLLFIGLEISSISSYVMAGFLRDDRRNNESALKYFLLGSFASAFLLYGIAWIYGYTGSTNLALIRAKVLDPATAPPMAILGLAAALMLVGLAFKVSAAPFQVWAPDVYEGAPAPVSAFLSVGPKAAAFAMLLRIFLTAFEPVKDRWEPVLWASALATMLIGNFAALRQSNIKRLLAYSSIAHAGYVLVAVTANSEIGAAAVMFYMAAYAATNIGAFAVVSHVARQGEQKVAIDDFAGLATRQPATAALMTLFLASLIGIPLTGGFFGKFYIFKAALDSGLTWLTILGLLNSALAAYYYLRVLVVMYMEPPPARAEALPRPAAALSAALWLSAAVTVVLGVYPSLVLDAAGASARLLP